VAKGKPSYRYATLTHKKRVFDLVDREKRGVSENPSIHKGKETFFPAEEPLLGCQTEEIDTGTALLIVGKRKKKGSEGGGGTLLHSRDIRRRSRACSWEHEDFFRKKRLRREMGVDTRKRDIEKEKWPPGTKGRRVQGRMAGKLCNCRKKRFPKGNRFSQEPSHPEETRARRKKTWRSMFRSGEEGAAK